MWLAVSLGSDEAVRRISDAIQAEYEALLCDGDEGSPGRGVLTGFVLVAEWAGDDGEMWLTTTRPDSQPYWRSNGMLAAAIQEPG